MLPCCLVSTRPMVGRDCGGNALSGVGGTAYVGRKIPGRVNAKGRKPSVLFLSQVIRVRTVNAEAVCLQRLRRWFLA